MRKYIIPTIIFILIIWYGISITKQWVAERCYPAQSVSLWENKITSIPVSQHISRLNKAIAIDSSNAEYHYKLAALYTRMFHKKIAGGRWKLEKGEWVFYPLENIFDSGHKSVKSYKNVLQLNPSNAYAHLNLGWILGQISWLSENTTNIKDLKKTINPVNLSDNPFTYLNKACVLAPSDAYILYSTGYYYLTQWDYLSSDTQSQTIEILKKVIKINGSYFWNIFKLCWKYLKTYDEVARIIPDNKHRWFAKYLTKKADWTGRRRELALAEYYELLKTKALIDKGLALKLQGKGVLSQKMFNEAWKTLQGLEDYYLYVSRLYPGQIDGFPGLKEYKEIAYVLHQKLSELGFKERNNFMPEETVEGCAKHIKKNQWKGIAYGKHIIKNGFLAWTSNVSVPVKLKGGPVEFRIQAKGSAADGIWPFMVVKLGGKVIGEAYINNKDWKDYIFHTITKSGYIKLSISFINDGGNKKRKEDRNLFVGDAYIKYGI